MHSYKPHAISVAGTLSSCMRSRGAAAGAGALPFTATQLDLDCVARPSPRTYSHTALVHWYTGTPRQLHHIERDTTHDLQGVAW